MGLKQ
jgi:hypothetical protein